MTVARLSEKRRPVTGRAYTMRELLTKARERFGADAGRLKTREELLTALGLEGGPTDEPAPEAPRPPAPLVVEDFFLPPRR